jgi:hypothetical protein
MVWPKGSRVWIFVALTAWSVGLSWACDLTPYFSVPFCALAVFIGCGSCESGQPTWISGLIIITMCVFYLFLHKLSKEEMLQLFNAPPQIWLTAAQVVHIPTVAEAIARSPARVT